jgi:hypothetical protein
MALSGNQKTRVGVGGLPGRKREAIAAKTTAASQWTTVQPAGTAPFASAQPASGSYADVQSASGDWKEVQQAL